MLPQYTITTCSSRLQAGVRQSAAPVHWSLTRTLTLLLALVCTYIHTYRIRWNVNRVFRELVCIREIKKCKKLLATAKALHVFLNLKLRIFRGAGFFTILWHKIPAQISTYTVYEHTHTHTYLLSLPPQTLQTTQIWAQGTTGGRGPGT